MTKPQIPFYYQKQGVTFKQWCDWRWQMANTITKANQLVAIAQLSKADAKRYYTLFEQMARPGFDAVRLTPFLISTINWKKKNDPIRLQHLPSAKEFNKDAFAMDKVWERPSDFADGDNRFIQQKYPDIVLLRLSSMCHSFCRFCFEKERTLRGQVRTAIGPMQFAKAVEYIKKKPLVRQVLISGGDPLIIPDEILLRYIKELAALPHISTIRTNSRALLHNPFRITEDLALALEQIQKTSWEILGRESGVRIELGVHFNHPSELTAEALAAIRRLRRHNVEVYNQSVLLKGINDSVRVLRVLFRKLRSENVRLHYLSHAMPVPGTAHMRTSIATGMRLMRELRKTKEFRGQLPHFETSHYAGKQMIPDVFYSEFKQVRTKGVGAIRFKSDITGRWETQP